jgi:hypothetical protein
VAYLTIHRLAGDPDDLLARKMTHLDPVTSRLAPSYGGIFSVTAQAPDGLVVVNLWDSADSQVRFSRAPEVVRAQQASGLPAPHDFERFDEVQVEPYAPR